MAAPLQSILQVRWLGRQALSTRVPEAPAETSTHHERPPVLRTVEQPQACSISRSLMAALVQSTLQVAWSVGTASTLHPSAGGGRDASHRGAAASLLDQYGIDAAPLQSTLQVAWSGRRTLSTRVLEAAETSTHLESPPGTRTVEPPQACSHQSELDGGSVAEHIAWRGRDGKHSPSECRSR